MKLHNAKPGSRRHDQLKHLEGVAGVYILWKKPNFYVGSTRNLRSRLRSHTNIFAGWEFAAQRLPIDAARSREIELIRQFLAKGFKILNVKQYKAAVRHPLVSRQLVYSRLKLGWSLDRACNEPPRK